MRFVMTHTPLVARDAGVKAPSSPQGGAVAFHDVVASVDGALTGRDAIALGEQLRDRDGQLTLAHIVCTKAPTRWTSFSPARREQAREVLEHERAAADVSAELTDVFASSVGSGLRHLAHGRSVDLLVVG